MSTHEVIRTTTMQNDEKLALIQFAVGEVQEHIKAIYEAHNDHDITVYQALCRRLFQCETDIKAVVEA
jgi:hypothetical protein